jgi:hypothetical protein
MEPKFVMAREYRQPLSFLCTSVMVLALRSDTYLQLKPTNSLLLTGSLNQNNNNN